MSAMHAASYEEYLRLSKQIDNTSGFFKGVTSNEKFELQTLVGDLRSGHWQPSRAPIAAD